MWASTCTAGVRSSTGWTRPGREIDSVRVDNEPSHFAKEVSVAPSGQRRERRSNNRANVAIARKVLALVYYGLRHGEIRCLADQDAA